MLTVQLISFYHLILHLAIYLFLLDLKDTILQDNDSGGSLTGSAKFVMAESPDQERDYYEVLGVEKGATKQEIHKAFRQKAKKYHPDKNKDKGAQDEFIRIFKAYETLSDEKKRLEYDERSKSSKNQNSFNWHSDNMHDFDINEFFKQYEDQLFRHSQDHFNHHGEASGHHHNSGHHKQAFFHGINLDDLFHDLDEDEFFSSGHGKMFRPHGHNHNEQFHHPHGYGDHHSYDQDTMNDGFGDGASFFGSYLPSQIHDTIHQFQHRQDYNNPNSNGASYSCHTVTKQVNGMIMTQTSCG